MVWGVRLVDGFLLVLKTSLPQAVQCLQTKHSEHNEFVSVELFTFRNLTTLGSVSYCSCRARSTRSAASGCTG